MDDQEVNDCINNMIKSLDAALESDRRIAGGEFYVPVTDYEFRLICKLMKVSPDVADRVCYRGYWYGRARYIGTSCR